MTKVSPQFTFEISLSTLNHLGRQLYRSFATVLGEAISNAWDADAKNVHIYLDADRAGFWIKDDGVGMTEEDFQNKFLRIGYSKRRDGQSSSPGGRPYIGRKGIGKLALLSCAARISILSKVKGGPYVGGSIDNSRLDLAITDDLRPSEYPLDQVDPSTFAEHTPDHPHGTIIRFEGLNEGVKRSLDNLRTVIALYFRFSLLDEGFNVFLDGTKVTHADLGKLVEKTEFLWESDSYDDPFVKDVKKAFAEEADRHETGRLAIGEARGFLASVKYPKDLKVLSTNERVGVDLFVNGRLRERDILKHIPTARIVESYLYGQIHFDGLDDESDRFTSSREGIIAEDPKYREFLDRLRQQVLRILDQWDDWRRAHREEGDSENEKVSKTQRASEGLFNAVTKEFELSGKASPARKVESWVNALSADAAYNFESYAECFVSENLLRKYIAERRLPLSEEATKEAAKYRTREDESKNRGNISIDVRRDLTDVSYLSMDDLANLVDKPQDKQRVAALSRDATEFKPMRDAVAHTALLTDAAKDRLRTVRENIKGRLKTLLSQPESPRMKSVPKPGKARQAQVIRAVRNRK